ncbi:ureidoglycolate lyase [Palleronia abyssalis]|uniref:Ureidoglycolate lyase n=1 Tax=Palleronia abyssalis TaxID=1501240 RepID=A0A2R8C0A2_9RHOB|nr:ureidoglycolate lyase [Palleronia abyssalis]SPJ25824.1 Ureidoglycolate lyase [Palleronia abyssalis]
MTGPVIRIRPLDEGAFAPFGEVVAPPRSGDRRRFYSRHFADRPTRSDPVVHVNSVPPSELPLACTGIERHPSAAQCFLPLDVARYVVMVMPSSADGNPDLGRAAAWEVPGNRGVIYHPMVWHMGATVLDRPGNFAVLMWRGGQDPDDEFRNIPSMTLIR